MPADLPDFKYYPAISDLIIVDDLPEILSFVKDGIQQVFDSVYYKDIQVSKSIEGSSAFYSLDIVSKQKIEIEIPGTGIYFILNPDYSDDNISSFPITVFWQWDILKYVNYFSVSGFSFSVDDLFNLALEIFNTTEEQALIVATYTFVVPSSPSISNLGQLVIDINTLYGSTIVIDESSTDPYLDLIVQVNLLNQEVFPTIFLLYITASDPAVATNNLNNFFSTFIPSDLKEYIIDIIKPKARATLELSAALEFPRNILLPMVQGTDGFTPDNTLDDGGSLKKAYIQFADALLDIDTDTGFGYQTEFAGTLFPQYAQVANTCLIISFTDVKLDLSTTTNIPEADAAGYPVDFVGAYIKQASIILNSFGDDDTDNVSAALTVENLLIGTGGVSGTIKLVDDGLLYRKFGEFGVKLDTFSITFRQNAIVNSSISGELTLPSSFNDSAGNPVTIFIDASIKDNGDFSVTAKVQEDFPVFTLPNVFTLAIRSLSIGKQGGRFFIAVAGSLDFIAHFPVLGDILPKGVTVNKLIIWDNGDLEFDGGGLVVPKSFRLQVGPVKLEVSHIALGSYSRVFEGVERQYYYFGFDGMVNTGNAGVEASGNGIKYYFTHDNGAGKPFDHFLSIDSIAIDITIPGDVSKEDATFIIQGYLSMKNPDPAIAGSNAGTEYTGKISFSMPKIGIGGSAAMRLTPSIPAFVVDIGLELSTPIPLGPTSLGIYGFRGLIGQHYLPSKLATTPPLPETASWWEYYKAKSVITGREGIEVDKFGAKSGFSIGAGASIATAYDSGFTFSSKIFLLLGLPEVFLIQGQAGIIRNRLGLHDDADPPFSALIIISKQSFEGHLDINFRLPDNGFILSLQASLELAFFFNNASGWYLNIGRDTPQSAQVQARLLTLFNAHAYLMISARGIKAGAGVSFDFNKSFGPVGVEFGAHLDMGGFISFKPVQIGAYMNAGGYAGIKFFGLRFGVGINVGLSVEAPNPFNITGSVHIEIRTPWFLPNINFNLDMSWTFNNDDAPLRIPIAVLSLPDPVTGYTPAIAINILTNEAFPLNYITTESVTSIPNPGDSRWKYNFTIESDVENVIIPLDSYIDIELLKPVIPGNILDTTSGTVVSNNVAIGGAGNQLPDGYSELVPPQKGVHNQIKHQYEIVSLDIYAWNGSAWVQYNIYEAVTAIVHSNTGPNAIDLSRLKAGYWQFTDKNKYNKIRLLSQNMFSYMNGTNIDSLTLDAKNFRNKDIFCYETVQKNNIVNWENVAVDTVYPENTPTDIQLLTFEFEGINGSVSNETSFNNPALLLDGNQGELIITFPVPVAHVEINLGDNQNNVSVSFIKKVFFPTFFGITFPYDETVSFTQIPASQQGTNVIYDNLDLAVNQVRLTFNTPKTPDYEGDLIIGGRYQLPVQYIPGTLNGYVEMYKALMFSTWYNQSFTETEVLALDYRNASGAIAQWPLDTKHDSVGTLIGIPSGSPEFIPGFYEVNSGQEESHSVFFFTSNADALVIPYNPVIKIENSSFAFEITAIFNPFVPGISTLFYKVKEDAITGYKKGFALHLLQSTPANPSIGYTNVSSIPTFTILLTCYSGLSSSGITITEPYTLYCANSRVAATQYKRIFVSVNRETGKIELYIDKILKLSRDIPAELSVFEDIDAYTYLNQISYVTEVEQARVFDNNQATSASLISEIDILSDTINRNVQPVWRPNTTYAVKIVTQDRVEGGGNPIPKTHIFGFKTAGPLGHFHQQSKAYQQLAQKDQGNAFKLASLQFYIDYERSFPDAQGRYNLSKPVLYHNPQVKLFFNQPYINAMYANWDSYLGLPAIQSNLQLQLLDQFGNIVTQHLSWSFEASLITQGNYSSLPPDQQMMYLFNVAASQGGCNPITIPLVKTLWQGSFVFPDLLPNKLYTALYNSVYKPDDTTPESSVEVYKYSFMTSRYATFQDQAGSFILDNTVDHEKYAIYSKPVSFTQDYIDHSLKVLLNDDVQDDPSFVLQYAIKFDRLVYGGLKLSAFEPFNYSVIQLIINTNPADDTDRKILGIMIYNPEPLNDPKLPQISLGDTVQLTLTKPDSTIILPSDFIYIHSRDNSAVIITNTDMNIPLGSIKLHFRYKIFNGTDYESNHEDYDTPNAIDITPYFNN